MHDEDRSGQPSLVMPELMESLWQAVLQNLRFTISELSGQFPQMFLFMGPDIGGRLL